MTWSLAATPEQRLREKLRHHASLRHVCVACDADDLRAVLEELDSLRAQRSDLLDALAIRRAAQQPDPSPCALLRP
jgi:hypothetical protein